MRGFGERLFGKARVEFGLDVNGRFGLHAVDDLITYNLAGNVVSTRPNVSVDTARRTDTGVFASIDTAVAPVLVLGAGIRGDYVTTKNNGGYFGDRSTGNGAGSGYASATARQLRRLQPDRAGRARLPRSGAVRSLLPRTDRARLHHRQSRSRSRDQPAVRPRRCATSAPRFRVAAFYYHYESTT